MKQDHVANLVLQGHPAPQDLQGQEERMDPQDLGGKLVLQALSEKVGLLDL